MRAQPKHATKKEPYHETSVLGRLSDFSERVKKLRLLRGSISVPVLVNKLNFCIPVLPHPPHILRPGGAKNEVEPKRKFFYFDAARRI
jgi:hypothetical protein